MLQASGIAHPKIIFLPLPNINVSLSIYRTWIALELPAAGITNLITHIHSQLMIGVRVTVQEMDAAWAAFSHHSDLVRSVGKSFVRSQAKSGNFSTDSSAISDWCLQSDERRGFFESLGHIFPDANALLRVEHRAYGNSIGLNIEETSDVEEDRQLNSPENNEVQKLFASVEGKRAEEAVSKMGMLLERNRTRRVSAQERRERFQQDNFALKQRLKRTKSDDSIRSVETAIWNPWKELESDSWACKWREPRSFTKAEIIAMSTEEMEAAKRHLSETEKQLFEIKAARYRGLNGARGLQAISKSMVQATSQPLDVYPIADLDAASPENQPKSDKLSEFHAIKYRRFAEMYRRSGRGVVNRGT